MTIAGGLRSFGEATPIAPALWAKTLSGAPVLDRSVTGLVPTSIRHWMGVAPDIDQSALDQHYISIHLGGPKRLWRRGEGGSATRDVVAGAHSVVPAGSAFLWQTVGPVDFAHFYFDPAVVDRVVANAFDRDPAHVLMQEALGESDPLVRQLALALLDELHQPDCQQAYLDDMLHLLLCRVLRRHSNARSSAPRSRHVLAPYRLRRALEFIEANLARQVGVADIAGASGVSRFHFSRSFRLTTGRAPYAYLLERRIVAAKSLLLGSEETLAVIASQCGFSSPSQFSRMFKRETGASPSVFRNGR